MHAQDMEAVEEEMRASEAFERRKYLEKAQSCLDQVLARCATLFDEDGDDDVNIEDAIQPKEKHSAAAKAT
ncbi:hypothetical protein GN244_ATG13998 [Phytophthora infestans]|uniref:Uncharacterized protein n=1 Tax=Phytophthora infestans TaxID=4787 RepID=A0A833VYJ3_PHYIN|nr:hypothetical protein GN244_ATG13998 [Phytophthora infestans]KAF4143905.1 hypothetical protein GN958_ATG06991 [Phytophthora infestans]